MKISSENRKKLLLIVACSVTAVFALDRFIIPPLLKTWRDRNAHIVDFKKSISKGSLLLAREDIIRTRWNDMLSHTLSNETSVAESQVLKAFDRWSQEGRMSITSIKPQWKQNQGNEDHQTLECRVDAFGPLSSVTRFLHEVEKDPLAVKVEVVELGARESDGSQISLGLQISGLKLTPNEP